VTTIELAGVTFKDHLESGETGWAFQSLTDWYGVPTSKAPEEPIPQGQGSFDPGVDYRSSAIPSFNAIYYGATEAEALDAVEDFCSLGTSEQQQIMRVTDALRATSREVSVRSVAQQDHHGRNYILVNVDTFAADPLRYGDPEVVSTGVPSLSGGIAFPIVFPIDFATTGSPGRMVTTNAGKQATFSRFSVSGGLSGGFSLIDIEDGREIRFEFPIATSDVVTVDPQTGRAWINDESNVLIGYLTRSDFWQVPPGSFRTIQFNPIGSVTGTPLAQATTPPAYL